MRAIEDGERIEQIGLLEALKSAAAAAQAVVTEDFAASQRAAQLAAGVPAERASRGVAAQVALARRESPHRGGQHVGLARALVRELPMTMGELRAGHISEWRATIVTRETACLDPHLRRLADAELAPQLASLGDGETEAAARRVSYRMDPHAFTARTTGAAKHRRVTLRPAPDAMSRLTGFLPVTQGVAAYAALTTEADRVIAVGDPRSRGQIMADLLVQRVTGQHTADAVPVEVHLVMSQSSLLPDHHGDAADTGAAMDPAAAAAAPAASDPAAATDEPAEVIGYGPIPAPVARAMIRDSSAQVWLRRLFINPDDGSLIAMDSRRRPFPGALRRFLVVRDRVCRTPWCDAPIRHADHVVAVSASSTSNGGSARGPTSAANGQGLCAACNYAKQAPGWQARPGPAGAGEVVKTVTPTGHRYASRPPPLPGVRPHAPSLVEQRLAELLAAA